MRENRIFRYVLTDAWGDMISQVDVIENLKEGNVRCLYFETDRTFKNEANTNVDFFQTAINCEAISKIKRVMHEHRDIFSFKEVEFPTVMDGVINTFEFASEKDSVHVIKAYNIWAIKEEVDVAFLETSDSPYKRVKLPCKGKEVVAVYDVISKILMDNSVNEKYLKLH